MTGCAGWAAAVKGYAAAPPSSVMNSRRLSWMNCTRCLSPGAGDSITEQEGLSQGSLRCRISAGLCRLGVKIGNTLCEQMFSALPPKAEVAADITTADIVDGSEVPCVDGSGLDELAAARPDG